jgi:hypothetical protein
VIAQRHHSLSRRLLVGLVVVSFSYWAVIAWLTIRDSVDEVYELFDVHLAQTALALLRVTDPDESDPLVIPNRTQAPPLHEIFDSCPNCRSVLPIADQPRQGKLAPAPQWCRW